MFESRIDFLKYFVRYQIKIVPTKKTEHASKYRGNVKVHVKKKPLDSRVSSTTHPRLRHSVGPRIHPHEHDVFSGVAVLFDEAGVGFERVIHGIVDVSHWLRVFQFAQRIA